MTPRVVWQVWSYAAAAYVLSCYIEADAVAWARERNGAGSVPFCHVDRSLIIGGRTAMVGATRLVRVV